MLKSNFRQLIVLHANAIMAIAKLFWVTRKRKKRRSGDDFSICVLNIHSKASSLPNLLAINREIKILLTVTWSHVGHLIKGSCLGASYTKSAPSLMWCQYHTKGGDMCFICHVPLQDHSVEMSCIFMGESSSQYVTTLKSLVTIGIPIVKKKNCFIKNMDLINMYFHWKIELIG